MKNTKQKICNTALSLFLEQGYNVGINEIIEKSGTSKGAFYHHFKSKDELFTETIDHFFFRHVEVDMSVNASTKSFKEKILETVALAFIPFKQINKMLPEAGTSNYLKILSEYPDHRNLRENNVIYFNRFVQIIAEITQTAINDKTIKNIDVQTFSWHVGLLIDGSIVNAILISNNVDEAELICKKSVEQMIDFVEL